jgi:hypothetical protein
MIHFAIGMLALADAHALPRGEGRRTGSDPVRSTAQSVRRGSKCRFDLMSAELLHWYFDAFASGRAIR